MPAPLLAHMFKCSGPVDLTLFALGKKPHQRIKEGETLQRIESLSEQLAAEARMHCVRHGQTTPWLATAHTRLAMKLKPNECKRIITEADMLSRTPRKHRRPSNYYFAHGAVEFKLVITIRCALLRCSNQKYPLLKVVNQRAGHGNNRKCGETNNEVYRRCAQEFLVVNCHMRRLSRNRY